MSDDHPGIPEGAEGAEPVRPARQIGRRAPEAVEPNAEAGSELALREAHDLEAEESHDLDPREVRFNEWLVSGFFIVTMAATIFFIWAYFGISIHHNLGQYSNMALGGGLTLALVGLGAGMIVWAKNLMPHERTVQERHDFNSPPADEKAAEDTFLAGIDQMGLGKYTIVRRTLIGALALLPLPIVVLLKDLGPLPHSSLLHTGWRKNKRLVDLTTRLPVKLGSLEIGGIQTVMPEGFTTPDEFALAPTMLIRFGPNEILSAKEKAWGYSDHVAYSKICTHAGCPISLYEQQTHNLLCPCHQSTFDMARDAKVIFGPAARPLPQLRIGVDAEGYFIALGKYSEPVGPSFWERR
jgi:ubiquinol-cytochrome c reductase iron-sulfur subunit